MVRALSPHPGPVGPHAWPTKLKLRLKGDRLHELYEAVKATSLGMKFLAMASGEPKLVWGDTEGKHGEFDGHKTIILNEAEKDVLSDCQWKQVIAMELGNFANSALFRSVFSDCEKGSLAKDDFVKAIVKIEFDSRNLVLDAHEKGEFGVPGADCPSIFTGGRMSFEDFIKDSRGADDRAKYEKRWDKKCKKKYLQEHPPK